MSSSETFTPRQLDAVRKQLWHQDGAALMTLDAARDWIEAVGLVPYMPRTQQLPAPMPSFVEAVLGRPENGFLVPSKAELLTEPTMLSEEDEEDEDAGELLAEESIEEEAPEEAMADDDDAEADEEDDVEDEEEDPDAEDDAETSTEEHVEQPVAEQPSEAFAEVINGFTSDQMDTARVLLARLIASGAVVPLNLLGTSNDTPDFICSAQAFSFVYTLRGDKGWKQAPSTNGAMSVSPLGLKAYEVLKEKGALTAGALVTELGREVTEAAVLRALSELWALERVLPVPQADGSAAVWELMTGRYIRHIKAGSNAGQPTALSALLSLYLGAVVAATTEEMEVFLSPLSARSRIREVVHGLSATRQLDEAVVEGRTLHYIAGALPHFPSVHEPVKVEVPQVSRYERAERPARPAFGDRPSKYPVRRPAAARDGGDERPARSDRERRPFQRSDSAGGEAPKREFTKPWDEERRARPAAGDGASRPYQRREGAAGAGDRKPYQRREGGSSFGGDRKPYPRRDAESGGERRPYVRRDAEGGGGERKPFNRAASFGDRKPFVRRDSEGGERKPYQRREGGSSFGGDRKPYPRRDAEGGGERRPYVRRDAEGGGDRKPFNRAGSFGDRKPFVRRDSEGGERKPYPRREGGSSFGGDRKPYPRRDAEGGSSRPPFGDRKPYPRRDAEGGGERRPYVRRDAEGGGERKPFNRAGSFGDRKPFVRRDSEGGERRPYPSREGGSSFGGERKPYQRRDSEGGASRPSFGGDRKPYPRRDAEGGGGERKPYSRPAGGAKFGGGASKFAGKSGGGFGRKPAGGFAGKKPGGPRRDAGDAPRAPRRRPEGE